MILHRAYGITNGSRVSLKGKVMLAHVYGTQVPDQKRRTVFLHGYPGVRSKQNRDVAEGIAHATGRESHVLLYPGLTQAAGEFSYQACLEDVHAYVSDLIARCGVVDVVGHSWGGFLALTLAEKFGASVGKLALMSPLLQFPELAVQTGIRAHFKKMATENPSLMLGNLDDRAREFAQTGEAHPIDALIRSIPEKMRVLFLQARIDQITPTEIAESKRPLFSTATQFELVDTDHSFLTGRDWLLERLTTFLR